VSAIVQALWLISGEETRQEMIELARVGERLSIALGASPYTRSAQSLTAGSTASAVGQWADEYTAQVEAGRAMPLSVLWAGVSGWDPRADVLVMRLVVANAAPWSDILNHLRVAPQAVRGIADWFASRAVSLVGGDETQQLQERAQRAWWATYAATLPAPPPVGQTGTTADGRVIPATAHDTPTTAGPQASTPWGKIIAAALIFGLLSGWGGHRR